ncbi:odorant receptor coreceptor-like, partial [Diaphorina citri]|uniref:Odorant receptor coreceptor-like n=1 Tax=Diaphorina citri TaxID=121845 RepID=A0A3Q0JK88_DIACI
MQKVNKHGLVGDLWPKIRLMQLTGMFILEFHEDSSPGTQLLRVAYCWIVTALLIAQYACVITFTVGLNYNNDLLAGGVVTTLFFTHGMIKYIYVGLKNKSFYRVLSSWNNANSHPVFAESNARYRAKSLSRMKRVLTIICVWTSVLQVYWVFSLVAHSQLCDGMFCSLVLFSCDQLKHLKEILKPLIDLSISQHGIPSSLDLFVNKSASSNKKL